MIRLVVNADDLGLHPRIDEGILRAHQEGIVTSATVLTTGRNAPGAVRSARARGLALGVHLCLTTHLPPAAPPKEVRWLAPGGRFRKDWAELTTAWAVGLVPPEEVELELEAQVARLRSLGAEPDHLDAHQHLHLLPGLTPIVERLARDEGLPLRWPSERPHPRWLLRPAAAAKTALLTALALAAGLRRPVSSAVKVPGLGLFDAGALDEGRLLSIVRSLPPGDHELGCHPGLDGEEVPEDPSWRYRWTDELAALCSPKVRAAIEARGIRLTTFGELLRAPAPSARPS